MSAWPCERCGRPLAEHPIVVEHTTAGFRVWTRKCPQEPQEGAWEALAASGAGWDTRNGPAGR